MRVLRPPVGEGEEGHVFAVALPLTEGLSRAEAELARLNKAMRACTCSIERQAL